MKSVPGIVLSAIVIGVSLPTAQAHHSFPATYLVDQEITLEGELVAFMFRNPHAFVHLNVKDKKGNVTRYAIEWGGASQLNQQGVTRSTFKPGDFVIITGNPGRNPEDNRMRMRRIERPADGFKWGFQGEDFQ